MEDRERKTQGTQKDGRVKDRGPVAIKMSVCAEADAHLPSAHTLRRYTCSSYAPSQAVYRMRL